MKPNLIDYSIFKKDINDILKLHNSNILNLSLCIIFFLMLFLIIYSRISRNKKDINKKIYNKLVYIKNNT